MKTFIKNFSLVSLCLYSIIAFISFSPNVSNWGNGGRAAYFFAALFISFVGTAIAEESNRK